LPSRRSVLISLGAALAGGLGAGAAVGAAGAAPAWIPGLRRLTPAGSTLPTAYVWANIAIPRTESVTLGGDLVSLQVPKGWKDILRGNRDGLYRDYAGADETWLRVRIFLAPPGETLHPRAVAIGNLDALRNRPAGLPGYRSIGQDYQLVETTDPGQRTKTGFQLRYSFILKQRRRYVLERYFDEGDVVYLVGLHSYSGNPDDVEPIVAKATQSLRRTDR
jgi:hypothetical protein